MRSLNTLLGLVLLVVVLALVFASGGLQHHCSLGGNPSCTGSAPAPAATAVAGRP